MNYFYLDPSALAKRYHTEEGSEVIDELLDTLIPDKSKRMFTSLWSIAETLSVLNRKARLMEEREVRSKIRTFLSLF